MSRAVKRYVDFHQHEPKRVGDFHRDLVIPDRMVCIGDAVNILYRSDKKNPTTGADEGWIDYIHDHKAGVRVHVPINGYGKVAIVPASIRGASELTWLGHCLGFSFADDDGEHEAKGTKPLPELYTTANGKALLVIQDKRKLLALIWGGRLGVEPRGIVN